MKSGRREKFGIKIPNNTREVLLLDRLNDNRLWAEAIAKEMAGLEKLGIWDVKNPGYRPGANFQKTTLNLIFDIKAEDLRRKARLVVGGHLVDTSKYEAYASNVKPLSVRILLALAEQNGLNVCTGDIGNAFPHAPTKECVYTVAGPEFGD